MTEWEPFRLGDALSVSHGFAFKGEFFRDEGDLVVLTPGNFLEQGGFKPKSGKEKYYEGPFPDRFLLAKSQVVVAMTEQSKGLLGSTATVPADNKYLHNQRIGLLNITDPRRLDLRFTYHLLNAPSVRQQIQATATGSKVRHTAPDRLESIIAPIPNIECQRRIGRALDNCDDLIENNRRRIEILEEMARLLYREWFVHFRFPGHSSIDLIDSDLGPIPKGWGQTCLADEIELARVNVRPFEHPDEGFDHYSIPAFDDRRLPSLELGAEIKSNKYLVSGECVMVSKLNPRFPRVWRVDRSCLDRRAVASTEFLVLTDPRRWTLAFVYGLVTSSDFANRLASTAGGTSTSHQRVKPADVMNMIEVSPPAEVVKTYSAQVQPILKLADNLLQQNEVLRESRDLLLPRLVSGELDVSELDLALEAVGA